MCGRLNIIDDPLTEAVGAVLGITFFPKTNVNLCPTENVSVLGCVGHSIHQLELLWGIKPEWATRVIINAQAESVASKPTFKAAYRHHRVVVPCTGWYEWKGEAGRKHKYLFMDPDKQPLFIAGIALENNHRLVTLTTAPNWQYAAYHNRMPLLINENGLEPWLHGEEEEARELLGIRYMKELDVQLQH